MKKLLLLMLLTACGSPHGTNNIDLVFQPIYDQFIADASAHGVHLVKDNSLTIKFATQNLGSNPLGETVAECSGVGYGGGTISVSGVFWESSLAPEQQLVIYHELGHCLLSEIHVSDNDEIMNALVNNSLPFFEDPNEQPFMIDRMFKQVGDGP